MAFCTECGVEKPDVAIKHGVCDKCYRNGPPSPADVAKISDPFAKRSLSETRVSSVILTTSIDVPGREIESVISIVATEVALGMNIFRDIANNWRDLVGGRAGSAQKSLEEARSACLDQLKQKAAAAGADAVIAVDLDYNELSTAGSGGILFVAACGTGVKLRPLTAI